MQNPKLAVASNQSTAKASVAIRPLKGVRILSLALNLPGPAALMRCKQMGATCIKLEPPAGDPMSHYCPQAYAQLHEGIKLVKVDLKTETGQARLHRELAKTDILITSFRPSAIEKLGLSWKKLHKLYPALSQIAIVGSPGARAEEAGHDLTYIAGAGLVPGLELPPTLYADMGGSLIASEAVMQAVMMQRLTGKGVFIQTALSDAAAYLALPHQWGLSQPDGMVGGAHAGYGMYACKDGRVALAALEPHFASRLCTVAGIKNSGEKAMLANETREAVAAFFRPLTRRQIDKLASENDIPLHTLSKA
jgi:alpha-methylacyl-CoA racemase